MITHQRITTAGKLHPDLMGSAGVQSDTHKAFFSGGQPVIFQSGLLDTAPGTFDNENLVLLTVFPEKIFPIAILRRQTMDTGDIFFHHGTVLYGL